MFLIYYELKQIENKLFPFVIVFLLEKEDSMSTIANVMQVYPDCVEEYQKRHDELWPEMEAALKAHSVSHYSIFLHPTTYQLFAVLDVDDLALWNNMSKTDICQKWWRYMEDVMETNSDSSPVSTDLKPVFYLD